MLSANGNIISYVFMDIAQCETNIIENKNTLVSIFHCEYNLWKKFLNRLDIYEVYEEQTVMDYLTKQVPIPNETVQIIYMGANVSYANLLGIVWQNRPDILQHTTHLPMGIMWKNLLQIAIGMKRHRCVRILLDMGIRWGSALIESVESPTITEMLLEYGYDPNYRDENGEIPIMACIPDNFETFKILLDAKADPNATDMYGNTALNITLGSNDYIEFTKELIDRGANIRIKNQYGVMPLDLMSKY